MTDDDAVEALARAAWGPVPGSGHYAAAKAGTNSLTETFAHELAPKIRVNEIAPGAVPTEIMMKALRLSDDDLPKLQDNLGIPLGRLGTPLDMGRPRSSRRRRPRAGSPARP
jgi:NAD(P)-dependent dehydrogenase (short-subunit alcohol dehydrogenase family)